MQNKLNFKRPQMNANKVLTRDYENIHPLGHPKNKAKQTQFKPKTNPISQELLENKAALCYHKRKERRW